MSIIEQLAGIARPILEAPTVRRVRRNHALEHGTIHVLSRRVRNLRVAGHSSHTGFVIIGNATAEQVESAAQEALRRMQQGEQSLAVHPNCGTNLVTSAFLTTLVAAVGLRGNRPLTPNRFSWVMTGVMVALLVSQPLGMALQRHFTTKGDPGDLEIEGVTTGEMSVPLTGTPVSVHSVTTRKG